MFVIALDVITFERIQRIASSTGAIDEKVSVAFGFDARSAKKGARVKVHVDCTSRVSHTQPVSCDGVTRMASCNWHSFANQTIRRSRKGRIVRRRFANLSARKHALAKLARRVIKINGASCLNGAPSESGYGG